MEAILRLYIGNLPICQQQQQQQQQLLFTPFYIKSIFK